MTEDYFDHRDIFHHGLLLSTSRFTQLYIYAVQMVWIIERRMIYHRCSSCR